MNVAAISRGSILGRGIATGPRGPSRAHKATDIERARTRSGTSCGRCRCLCGPPYPTAARVPPRSRNGSTLREQRSIWNELCGRLNAALSYLREFGMELCGGTGRVTCSACQGTGMTYGQSIATPGDNLVPCSCSNGQMPYPQCNWPAKKEGSNSAKRAEP